MAKRPKPIEEGVLATIYKKFVSPLVMYKPDDINLKEWLNEDIFHHKFRDIITYKARADFMLPGLFLESAIRKIQGIGYRLVKKDSIIIARKDHRETFYNVEFFGGVGNKDQVFELSESQWNSIAAKLEECR